MIRSTTLWLISLSSTSVTCNDLGSVLIVVPDIGFCNVGLGGSMLGKPLFVRVEVQVDYHRDVGFISGHVKGSLIKDSVMAEMKACVMEYEGYKYTWKFILGGVNFPVEIW